MFPYPFLEAAYMAKMSGNGEAKDSRVEKLDKTPTLCTVDIADGWNIRVKIAYDVDNAQYFSFGTTHGGIVDYYTYWGIYYCVYLNNDFKYASCNPTFYAKYHENYQNADTPDRLYSIEGYTDFVITSGEKSIYKGQSGNLTAKVSGTCIYSRTPYSWTSDGQRIQGETETNNYTFSNSKNDFFGSGYGGNYIVNGGADDFKNAVYGLHTACVSIANQ